MSQKNVETAQRGWEHFLATGEPAWDTLHAEVEARDHDIFDGREYRGHAGIQQWLFEDWASAWSEWSAGRAEFIDAGEDSVVVLNRIEGRGKGSGARVQADTATVWALEAGKVVGLALYLDIAKALEAAGLRE